jgi:hypothetical protein
VEDALRKVAMAGIYPQPAMLTCAIGIPSPTLRVNPRHMWAYGSSGPCERCGIRAHRSLEVGHAYGVYERDLRREALSRQAVQTPDHVSRETRG